MHQEEQSHVISPKFGEPILIETVSLGLYTDESPGLKVDPVVVLVLSLGFIFSVVALHSTLTCLLL